MDTSSGTAVTLTTPQRRSEQFLADAVQAAAGAVVAALSTGGSERSREEWVALRLRASRW